MLLLWLYACAPHVGFPGPLGGLGAEPAPDRQVAKVRPPRPAPAPPTYEQVVATARAFVGARELRVAGKTYRFDCSGFVEASLASAGCYFGGSSANLFDMAKEHGVLHRRRTPTPGDVAFFDNTWDRNRNGRVDDPLSHVAIVESVDPDGTIHLVHIGSGSVGTLVMNLRHPEERKDADGKPINDYLRVKKSGDSPRSRYLSGELWVAFGSFWKVDRAVAEGE